LHGQTALITGGSRGIGRAISVALAAAGANVAVAARRAAQLDETVALIQEQGGEALALPGDVTDEPTVDRLVAETVDHFGGLTLLVNNAGIAGQLAPIWEGNADEWWRVLEVNLRGPFLCARAALRHMIARRRGRIINIASNVGTRPAALSSAYSVSKGALLRLTDCLAAMTKEHGVHVFAISPGLVRTAMTHDMPIFKDVPEAEWTPPERAGELCVFLATGAADGLSGRYIHVQDDIQDMVRRADEIEQQDLYALRLRQ